jgi:hypothetical protein
MYTIFTFECCILLRIYLTDSLWRRQSQQSFNTLTPFNLLFYSLLVSAPVGHPQVRYTISYYLCFWRTILIQRIRNSTNFISKSLSVNHSSVILSLEVVYPSYWCHKPVSWGGVRPSPLGTPATVWPTVPAPDEDEEEFFFVHDKSHMSWPGFEPGPSLWEAGDYSPELWHGHGNDVRAGEFVTVKRNWLFLPGIDFQFSSWKPVSNWVDAARSRVEVFSGS